MITDALLVMLRLKPIKNDYIAYLRKQRQRGTDIAKTGLRAEKGLWGVTKEIREINKCTLVSILIRSNAPGVTLVESLERSGRHDMPTGQA